MKTRRKRVESRSRQRNWQLRQRAAGRCIQCGAPAVGERCAKHRIKYNARQKLKMRRRRAVGKK